MNSFRPTLLDIKEKELAVLEAHFTPGWTDVMRDFAISVWITLVSRQKASQMEPEATAALAVDLAIGIAQDLGGSQPYIPVGLGIQVEQRKAKVLQMLAKGSTYDETAKACGLTKSRVRQLERQERQEKKKARNEAMLVCGPIAAHHTTTQTSEFPA